MLPLIRIRVECPWRRSLLPSAMLSFVGVKSCKAAFTLRHVATTCCNFFQLIPSEDLVLEDLIQNAHTLFDERPPPSQPVPSPRVAETTSIFTFGTFLSPEFPRSSEAQAVDSTTRHLPTSSTLASNRRRPKGKRR